MQVQVYKSIFSLPHPVLRFKKKLILSFISMSLLWLFSNKEPLKSNTLV